MKLHPNAFRPCIAKIAQRSGVDEKRAEELLQEVASRAETFKRRGEADPYGAAARQFSEELKKNAAKDRTDAIRNSMIRKGIIDMVHVNGLENAALTLEGAMVNVNTRLAAMRAPLEEVSNGMAFRWLTAIKVQMEKAGMGRAFDNGSMDKELARELWKLSQSGPKQPPKDKIGIAAYILNGPLFDAGERLKAAGAKFDHAIDYITRTKHDSRAMSDAGFEKWWKQTEARLHDRTWDALRLLTDADGNVIETVAEGKRRFGERVYNGLVTDVHRIHGEGHSMEGDTYIPPAFEGTRNLAKSLSHERVLYWKDSDSWLAHMREFGGMTSLNRTIHETLIAAARHTALMDTFGTNPMGSLKMMIRSVQEHYRDAEIPGMDSARRLELVNKFTRDADHLKHVMAQLDGSANMGHSRWANDIVNTLKNIENASMLGAVGLTHFSALPMSMSSLGPHYNLSRFELFANNLRSLITGAASGDEMKQVMQEAGAFYHGSMVHFWSEFKQAPTIPGKVSAIAAMTLKATGLNYILEQSQNGFRHLLMHKVGRDLDIPYSELGQLFRDNLAKYEIGEKEWKMLQGAKAAMINVEGRRYATPKDFERLSDAIIDQHNTARIEGLKQEIEDMKQAHMHADAKEENWTRDRTAALETHIQTWRDRIDKWSEQRDFRKSEIYLGAESKVEEMRERIKEAKVSQRMAKHVQSLKTADEVKAWTDEVRQAMENERERLKVDGAQDADTEALFSDLAHGVADEAKGKQAEAVIEGGTAQESLATKYGRFLTRSESRVRKYRSAAAEKIKAIEGKRLSDVERFEKTGKMKTNKPPAEHLGKDDADTAKFTEMVKDSDEAMREFEGRSQARIWQRAERLETAENRLPEQIDRMRKETRWKLADNYAAFIAHAGKEATIAAGAREKAWAAPVTGTGALGKMMMQFKMWPLAVINQVHGREWYAAQTRSQMGLNFGSLLGLSMAGGMFRMMIRDASSGNPIRDPRDPETMMAALMQGGGIGLLGDFAFGETNRMGGDILDTVAGPVLGDVSKLTKIFWKARDDTYKLGEETVHGKGHYSDIWADLLHFTKGHIPMANAIGIKGPLDYLVWQQLFEAVSPGYWERMNKKKLHDTGRAMSGYVPNMGPPGLSGLIGK